MTKKELVDDIMYQFEIHSVEGIKKCFSEGLDPNDHGNELPLLLELVSMYTRSRRFKDCVQAFVDAGLQWNDDLLISILTNNATALEEILQDDPVNVHKKYTLRSTYAPLEDASLLHICAEFNHVDCAKVLVKHGADIEASAGKDEYGFGGQTPIFHTVNQNTHQSADMLEYLLSLGTNLQITVAGIVWGKGFEWETLIPSVNPISYAMMGLLPQMHRNEKTIADTVSLLLRHGYGIEYKAANVPNKYLSH